MGRGEVISGGTGGQYTIKLLLHRDRVTTELASLATKISVIENHIADLESADVPNAVLISAKKLLKLSYEKRVQYLNDNIEDDPTVEAWCADLTTDLAGEVGTIEVPGERAGVPVVIQPGHMGAAAYNTTRDGQLQPCLGGTPSSVFYNLAMMPGWQKWKPTYRLGEITVKDGDTCSVAIDPATFSDRGSGLSPNLNINQDTDAGLVTLDNIPIEYMNCNGVAFEVGDRVIVKFTDQDWSQPVVIGFEDNPKPCEPGLVIFTFAGAWRSVLDNSVFGGVYDPANDPNGTVVWNYLRNELHQVPKEGGGFWEYPISTADRQLFLWNLRDNYGGAYMGSLVGLFTFGANPSTNMTFPTEPNLTDYVFSKTYPFARTTPQPYPSAHEYWDLDYYFPYKGGYGYDERCDAYRTFGDREDPDYIIIDPPDGADISSDVTVDNSDSGTVANTCGYIDTFDWLETAQHIVEVRLRWDWYFDLFYGSEYPACGRWEEQGTLGPFNSDVTEVLSVSFSGESGGFPIEYYVGSYESYGVGKWPQPAVSAVPVVLTAINHAGASAVAVCAAITWEGSIARDETLVSQDRSISTDDASRVSIYSGTLTPFLGGSPVNVTGTITNTYDNIGKTGSITNTGGKFIHSRPRVDGKYNSDSGLIVNAVIESIYETDYTYTTAEGVVFESIQRTVKTKIAIETVEDVATQDPWLLADNAVVQSVLDSIIARDFLSTAPGDGYFLDLDVDVNGFLFPQGD